LNEFVYGAERAEEMNEIRARLMQEIQPLLAECKNAKEFATAMFKLCHANGLQEKCNGFAEKFTAQGNAPKAKEYEKIYPACMDLLNQMYELIGADEMDAAEFLSVFEAGVAEIRVVTIPQNVDQVVIGDIERTRLKKIKSLFFIGVNDGVIPGGSGSGGLLSDMERQFFIDQGRELAPSPDDAFFVRYLIRIGIASVISVLICFSDRPVFLAICSRAVFAVIAFKSKPSKFISSSLPVPQHKHIMLLVNSVSNTYILQHFVNLRCIFLSKYSIFVTCVILSSSLIIRIDHLDSFGDTLCTIRSKAV
jgi:hypothetical protein